MVFSDNFSIQSFICYEIDGNNTVQRMEVQMDNVINFPSQRKHQGLPQLLDKNLAEKIALEKNQRQDNKPVDFSIFSSGEDSAFMDLIKEWPCFHFLDEDTDLQELFDRYYDDELTQSQDCVLEFMFHMHDPDSAFDISNALYTWEEDDKNFFLMSLNMHAELIDQIKREEL